MKPEDNLRSVFNTGGSTPGQSRARAETAPSSGPSAEQAKQLGGEVKQKAGAVAQDAKQVAKKARDSAVEQTRLRAEEQKHLAAGRVHGIATAVDRFAEELNYQHEPWLSDRVSAMASGVRRASQQLHEKRLDDMANEVRGWSKSPVLFLGGAFAIGLAAGRFLKSSQRDHAEPAESAPSVDPYVRNTPVAVGDSSFNMAPKRPQHEPPYPEPVTGPRQPGGGS